ncbi:CLUMA_CG005319, isoform A, partial [Clunio marinus]
LPDEIFFHIFQYVNISSRKTVSLVCRKFYELICIVERDCHPLDLSYQQICDGDIHDSIVNSFREFEDLTINLKHCRVVINIENILDVMVKFGGRIKRFKLWCSIQSESSELLEWQLIKILNCLPNVEDLTLRNICVGGRSSDDDSELNMHKLRNLMIDYCMFDSPNILNKIPKDTVRDLIFTFEPVDETSYQQFFNKQTKIRKLEIFENDQINFSHLELEHLKISSNINLPVVLRQQPKLRYLDFAITWIDNEIFTAMCELKDLEVAKMLIDQVSCHVFKSLKGMFKLKELRLDSHCSYDGGYLLELSMMQFLQIEKFTLLFSERKISQEILIQLSQNFRKLKHIEFLNRSISIINTLLEYFPNLESILFDFFSIFGAPEDILIVSEDLRHENLKQFVVININMNEVENTRSLLKLISVCPNLERIMLSKLTGIFHEDLQQIFDDHPKLTHLSLEFDSFSLQYQTIQLIQSAVSRLKHIRFDGLSNFPSYSILKILFEDEFPNITFYKYSTGDGQLIMKKRNVSDWYLDFKLMDHF